MPTLPPSPPYDPMTPALPYTPSSTVSDSELFKNEQAAHDHLHYVSKQTNDKATVAKATKDYQDAARAAGPAHQRARKGVK